MSSDNVDKIYNWCKHAFILQNQLAAGMEAK